MDEQTVFSILVGFSLAALVAVPIALRRRRQRRDELALAGNVARGLGVPASLHPVIDTDRCIGSLACLKACPEGDILGIIDGAARLVHGTNCVGHGRCAAACPVNAITLVFGSSARGVDLPEVDGRFESSRPGVHLVGELAGMGLIGNAVEQGAQCARYLADELAGRPGTGEGRADLVVIGAGPAGIACALEARARGLAVRLLDRGCLGGAMASYPRQGLVMAGPLELPGVAALRQPRLGKLELIAWFQAALVAAGLRVDEGVEVTGLSGRDGDFTVETGTGPLATRKVVLATGRGGAPRRLGVPGEERTKVTQALANVEQYAGARVLVVGGGDVAVEAACALVEAGSEVTLVHRGAALDRCRQENRDRALRLAGQGRLALRLGTEVQRIDEWHVTLRTGGELHLLANHYVITCLGGETAWPFLARMGVELRRPVAGSSSGPALPQPPEEASRRRWQRGLTLAGAAALALVAGLWWMGRAYYALPPARRLGEPLHLVLKPAGRLGLGIGITATAVMLTNFLYALRKRWRVLAGVGSLGRWLDAHLFVGLMSPVVIAFHAAFQSNNLLASGTYAALAVVVLTGLVGRWFYGLVPGAGGAALERADLLGQMERLKDRLAHLAPSAPLEPLIAEAGAPPSRAPFVVQLLRSLPDAAAFRLRLVGALRRIPPGERTGVRDGLVRLRRLRAQVGLFGGIRRLMRVWRSLHVALAVLLVAALAMHIGVAIYLGYGPSLR